jgi:hypothetical protein
MTFAALLTTRPMGSAVGRPRGAAGRAAAVTAPGLASEFVAWLTRATLADTSTSIDKVTNAVISIDLSSKESLVVSNAAPGSESNPAQVHALPATIKPEVIDAFANALHVTFVAAAAFAATAVVAVLFLPRTLHPGESSSAASASNGAPAPAAGRA